MRRCWLAILFFFCLMLPAQAVTVLITYGDGANEGFNDPNLGAARRNAFESAAAEWGQKLNGNVSVRINAFFDPLGGSANSATLGQAGPESFFEDWTGAPQSKTFYAVALANQLADTDLDPGFVDITATFNSDVDNNTVLGTTNFYYGTDLQAGNDIDFYTIVLHELCHGLGFIDTVNTNGSFSLTNPSVFDRHLANGSASASTLISTQSQSQRAAALIGNSLFFSGVNTRAANSNANAKLYAPNPYESGSSVSHLDETTYSPPPDGTASNANEELMTPYSSVNTHTVGSVLSGILKDLGWSFQTVSTPAISINNVSLNEGNNGTTNATLTVTLSGASSSTVTVNFTTTNGTAAAGSDYTTKSGTLTFTPGQTSKTISVAVTGDTTVEPNETFFVDLSSPLNATIAQSRGTVTIVNDDSATISINDVSVTEGNSGSTNATLTVTLSNASSSNVTVNFATNDASAVAASDYVAKNGTVTFTPGQTSRTIVISILGNTIVEPDETFFVDLSSPVGATLADNRGVVTIVNDDSATLSINSVSLNEGNSGTTNAVLTVTLSNASSTNVTVNYTTTNGTALASSDYTAKSGALTFTPGQTSQPISVAVIGDTVVEADETCFVDLSSPTGATIAQSRGTITIINDDIPDPNAPVNVSLTPRAATDAPNTARTFTAVYSDPAGNANISQAMLQINTSTSGVGGLRCYYAATNNLLFFLNDAGTGFLGGFAPGSNNVISNSRGSLDCANTTVTRSGNNITIAWSVKATSELSGLRMNCFLFVRNKSNLIDNFEAFGNWLITGNVAPVNVSLSPANTTANLGVVQDLTTVYSDANGANSLSQVMLRVGTPFNDCLQGFYDQLGDKLYLLNDTATGYLGGFAAGSNNTITTQHGFLDCANTTVTRNGNVLTIKWHIAVTNNPWAGTKQNVWMFARDRGNLLAPFAIKGSWTVSGNAPPSNVSITPNTIVSPLNSQQIVAARYQDSNGASNLSQVILRMGNILSTGLQVFYDVQANRLYLINDAGNGYIGGFAPGSNNTITNSRGKLHCLTTSVNLSGSDLFINWSMTLTSASYANTTQNLFLFCRDRGNLLDNYKQFGTWQITSAGSSVNLSQKPQFSNLEVNLAAQTVILNFAEALPEAANDASNFAVQINNRPLKITSAKRNGSSVTLQLPGRSIYRGDEVVVAWRNLLGSGEAPIIAE